VLNTYIYNTKLDAKYKEFIIFT